MQLHARNLWYIHFDRSSCKRTNAEYPTRSPMAMQEQEPLITNDAMASHISVMPATVAIWARQGRIPAHWLGRRMVRFKKSEVVAALKASAAASLGKEQGCLAENEK